MAVYAVLPISLNLSVQTTLSSFANVSDFFPKSSNDPPFASCKLITNNNEKSMVWLKPCWTCWKQSLHRQ